ncbi:MAG TPA: hypothetical protein VLH81_11370 [Desulfobacterales bacterium]|nr:hypothetical protein [Desulfobacterales bacterium]
MNETTRPGGLYRNASGHGFHDAHGHAIPLAELPRELLNEAEEAELLAAESPAPEPEQETEPRIPVDVPQDGWVPTEGPKGESAGKEHAEKPKAPGKRSPPR